MLAMGALRGWPPWPWPPRSCPPPWPGIRTGRLEDPATRKIQRIQFHKNLAMIGGLIFSALDEPNTRPK